MDNINGIIVKVISEFFYVKLYNGQIYECKAKGFFRYKNIQPIVGDKVLINIKNDKGMIYDILIRKNELYRPKIANIDQVIIICAMIKPKFNSCLLDKYLAFIEYKNLKPVIVFTKKDLISQDDRLYDDYFNWYSKMGYEVYFISNKKDDSKNWNLFKGSLANKISVLTGQTGSGKSSTLNSLFNKDFIKTQEISKVLGQGKHTTTNSQLYELLNGMIADTPGFSSFNIKDFTKKDLSISYQTFYKMSNDCKFRGCLHNKEPGCKIKELVKDKIIAQFFYEDYLKILSEI